MVELAATLFVIIVAGITLWIVGYAAACLMIGPAGLPIIALLAILVLMLVFPARDVLLVLFSLVVGMTALGLLTAGFALLVRRFNNQRRPGSPRSKPSTPLRH